MKTKRCFVVFWDTEIKLTEVSGVTFLRCNRALEFYEKAKKTDFTIVVINKKSTIADKAEGNLNLTVIKKFLDDYRIPYLFFYEKEQNFQKTIENFLRGSPNKTGPEQRPN